MGRLLPVLLLLAGCNEKDVCAGFSTRACIALQVDSASPLKVDQLQLVSINLKLFGVLTPFPARAQAVALPVQVAIIPDDPLDSVVADLQVNGLISDDVVGSDSLEATLHHGEHLRLTAHLLPTQLAGDLGGVDLAGVDLNGVDLAGVDLATHDLATALPHFQAAQNGLSGGPITALVLAADVTLFAATAGGGVFHSSTGATWQAVNNGITDLGIAHLAADPTSAGTLYADSFNLIPPKIFRTTDSGAHWSVITPPSTVTAWLGPIAVDPGNGKPIFEFGGDIYRADDGINFALINGSSPLPKTGSSADVPFQLLFTQAGHVLAVASSGIFRSTDGGVTWAASNTGLPTTRFLDPMGRNSSNGELYVSTSQSFRSFDEGQTWNAVTATNLPQLGAYGFASDGSSLFAFDVAGNGTSGVQRSTDDGASFSAFNSSLSELELSTVLAISGPRTFAATHHSGIFSSTGGAWSNASIGLNAVQVTSLGIHPSLLQTVYAGTAGMGVFKSSDGGQSWTAHATGLPAESVVSLGVDPNVPSRVYAGMIQYHGIFRSDDAGLSWNQASVGLGQTSEVRAIVFDPRNSSLVYAATSTGIFRSSDRGDSWSSVSTGITHGACCVDLEMTSLLMDPGDSQTLWASSMGSGVWKTTNGGASWSQTSLTMGVGGLAIDRQRSPRRIFAVTSATVMRSDDGGATFSSTGLALMGDGFDLPVVAVDPTNGDRLFVGDAVGAFFSSNGGGTFNRVDDGAVPLRARALLADSGGTVWLGARAAGGLFRTP